MPSGEMRNLNLALIFPTSVYMYSAVQILSTYSTLNKMMVVVSITLKSPKYCFNSSKVPRNNTKIFSKIETTIMKSPILLGTSSLFPI